ncbi:MAG: CpsD/CapB family tyrosine-protein kinase [Clostridiales bacterium]|nr:CpsD/CapB family tyrosine-protein kinase [Clostridiales bacterium]
MILLSKSGKRNVRRDENFRIQEERRSILSDKSDFFIREAYKTLRTNVTFSLAEEDGCKVIIVTSSLQSEGKSTTALNLAISFAEADKRVLLIDCDLRRPKLGRLLELNSPEGLSDLLLDPGLLDKGVVKNYGGISVILAGAIPPNPSELLGSVRMEKLLDRMKEKYDYIILDTPPVNMVTDAVVLAPRSSGVLFVVRANQSERGSVVHAVSQLEYARAKLLGFVLNGVDMEKSAYGYGKNRNKKYGKYGGYRYGYGRGYGYGAYAQEKPAERDVQ